MSQVVITGTGRFTPAHGIDKAALGAAPIADHLAPGAVGVVCSFGAGYSAGSVVVRRQCAS